MENSRTIAPITLLYKYGQHDISTLHTHGTSKFFFMNGSTKDNLACSKFIGNGYTAIIISILLFRLLSYQLIKQMKLHRTNKLKPINRSQLFIAMYFLA
jgi:hypothetical protein